MRASEQIARVEAVPGKYSNVGIRLGVDRSCCSRCGRRDDWMTTVLGEPLCGRCHDHQERIKQWGSDDPKLLMALCEKIGVGALFCRDRTPPALTDDGIRERVEKRPPPVGGLLIVGPCGSHKTHLAAARAVDVSRRGYSAKLVKWSNLCLEIRDTFQNGAIHTEADIIRKYVELDHLCIDDLGVGRVDHPESDASLRIAYELFDARYDRGGKRCTLDVTSNLTPEQLEAKFDPRVARRIHEMCSTYPMLLKDAAK